ncbi:MAG: hypothetical protein Q8J74_01005 [Candidatus Didemnitutus sp.]|nr:hypothetical protein [Candidatus Didemnitutus sp.]
MSAIEYLIILLLLFMAAPDLCRLVRRPALIYPVWVIFGLMLGIGLALFLCRRAAARLNRLFQDALEKATHWRLDLVILLVLVVCVAGHNSGFLVPRGPFPSACS